MINSLLRTLIALCLPALVVSSAMGQTSPTAEEILAAWMSSQHANAESEAFRHWDSEGEIPGNCAVCHSSAGFVDYVSAPQSKPAQIDHPVPIGTTVECATCHNPASEALKEVIFPGDTNIDMSSGTPVCAVCHQGRASRFDVDMVVADIGEDDVSDQLAFVNIHYSAAATTQQGSAVGGGYEYEGLSYAGPFGHVPGFSSCASCHDAHATVVKLENCTTCHAGVTDFRAIRTTPLDILADGNTGMGIAGVIDQLHDRLEAAILT
ncbi:MAG: polyheme membrane-associated cytochrome C, partial [Alphaproteobacteria bacterium]|nr:polyheme membrane-associated cytochrome C [Alphaproteobacteria bacterium]